MSPRTIEALRPAFERQAEELVTKVVAGGDKVTLRLGDYLRENVAAPWAARPCGGSEA
jgi:hypothetical protein